MPETRGQELEQLKAIVAELKTKIDAQTSSEVQQLRDQVAQLQNQLSNSNVDMFRIPDPIRHLSEFTGNKIELNAWLDEVREIYDLFRIKGENGNPDSMNSSYIRAIKNKIRGDARAVLCANGSPNTIPAIIEILKQNYGDQRDFATNVSILFNIKRGDKNHNKFYNEVKELITKLKANLHAHPLTALEIVDLISVTKYLDNIDEPLGSIIRSRQPKTVEDAYHFVSINKNAETRAKPFKNKFVGSAKINTAPPVQQQRPNKPFKRYTNNNAPRAEHNSNEVNIEEENDDDDSVETDNDVDNVELQDELNFQTVRIKKNLT